MWLLRPCSFSGGCRRFSEMENLFSCIKIPSFLSPLRAASRFGKWRDCKGGRGRCIKHHHCKGCRPRNTPFSPFCLFLEILEQDPAQFLASSSLRVIPFPSFPVLGHSLEDLGLVTRLGNPVDFFLPAAFAGGKHPFFHQFVAEIPNCSACHFASSLFDCFAVWFRYNGNSCF